MGAHHLHAGTRTIIDIGGQDCKAIKLDTRNGRVTEFAMNDKCAAGSGRFLEKTAEMLGYQLEELGSRSMESTKELQMSSQCVVFAESEIISLKAKNEKAQDIAAGVHFAIARRVCNLVNRIGLDPDLAFSGCVSGPQASPIFLLWAFTHASSVRGCLTNKGRSVNTFRANCKGGPIPGIDSLSICASWRAR